MTGIVVIGAGQAGSSLVARFRTLGFKGALTLVGEEAVPPYQRPPLSKGYLLGDMQAERLFLRPERYYAEHSITLKLGAKVTSIDRAAKQVHIGDDCIGYDQLALATGAVPRSLSAAAGGELGGVHVIRTLADIDRMKPEVQAGKRVLIVGGGYIGLEAAAVMAKLGLIVAVIEAAPRILQRVAAPETADYFRNLHLRHGVSILDRVGVDRLIGESGRVTGAQLIDGREIAAELVIVGIGVSPATGIAASAGLALDNGIAVDAHGRTSDPAIWAAGDCASFPLHGAQIRLESVGNAIDHAECVAGNMLGAGAIYMPKPWFWSDQYDVKLQIVGLNTGYDHVITRIGKGNAVSFWYYFGSKLLAVDAANDPSAYMTGKRIIEAGKSVPPDCAADPSTDLKSLMYIAQ